MKSELIKENEQEIAFPYLAEASNGAIFIVNNHFNGYEFEGICVKSGGGNYLGQIGSKFSLQLITPLPKGQKIILEND